MQIETDIHIDILKKKKRTMKRLTINFDLLLCHFDTWRYSEDSENTARRNSRPKVQ